MEKFMYIFHGGSDNAPEMRSPEAMQAHMQKWFAWVEKLRKEGRYIAGEPLQPSGKMVTGKKKIVTDGPFAEGKEVVGGFFIIEAKDINEATELAKDCPDFIYDGAVQVRPVRPI